MPSCLWCACPEHRAGPLASAKRGVIVCGQGHQGQPGMQAALTRIRGTRITNGLSSLARVNSARSVLLVRSSTRRMLHFTRALAAHPLRPLPQPAGLLPWQHLSTARVALWVLACWPLMPIPHRSSAEFVQLHKHTYSRSSQERPRIDR